MVNSEPNGPAAVAIRVLIVDDHVMVSQAFARIIAAEPDLCVVGIAADTADALVRCAVLQPDVVVMDVDLPSGDGIACAGEMKRLGFEPRVLILTGRPADEHLARAIDAGCDGLLLKTAPGSELCTAIRRVQAGEGMFSAADVGRVLRAARRAPAINDLSEREVEVLQCLAEGQSTVAIASTLYISVHTVRSHIRHILAKLDAHSKLEAVATALRDGLVRVPINAGTDQLWRGSAIHR